MSAGLRVAVRRWWNGEGGVVGALLRFATMPLEAVYRVAVAVRNRRLDRSVPRGHEDCPVVSVGNLTVGGTGKTPFVSWVIGVLRALDRSPAVVARGYGEDEVLLHARWHPGIPVVAHPDRVAAVGDARAAGARSVVADDAFQHRRMARVLDLVLVAAEDPWPGPLLPRGPYREPVTALRRADAVVVTRRTASPERADGLVDGIVVGLGPFDAIGVVAFEPGGWSDLEGRAADAPAGPVLVAAGIARPEAFLASVGRALQAEAELVAFPDHHRFTGADVAALRARAGGRTLVVTEKDAVKLAEHAEALGPVRVLGQTMRWERGEEAVRNLIERRTRSGV